MKRALLAAALLALACHQAPYTGRSQFILFSPAEEQRLGAQAYKETLSKAKVLTSGTETELVRRVGHRIAPVADEDLRRRGMRPFEWEFTVIDEKTVNAWCLPGGKVAFYTGILPACQGEEGIATVMGHEIGHAIARHSGERLTAALGADLLGNILAAGFSKSSKQSQEAILGIYGIGSGGLLLAHSREQETEADHIGLMLMAKAGYDPAKSIDFWRRMAAQSQGGLPEFLSTHPSDQTRIANLQRILPEARKVYSPKK